MNSAHLLALLSLFVAWVDSFSWVSDIIVVGGSTRLNFYNNGTLTHTEHIWSADLIYAITYDPVHYRVLFADRRYEWNHQIASFDLITGEIQPLVTRTAYLEYLHFAYEPVKQLLFWKEKNLIYSISLNPASSNEAVDGNVIVRTSHNCYDIAVDSCGGYIYWMNSNNIERARFDGSKRQVLIGSTGDWRSSLTIDQQTQKMYWIKKTDRGDHVYIESADFNGKNRKTLHTIKNGAVSLTVSNDFFYWKGNNQDGIWQLPKNHPQQMEAKRMSNTNIYSSELRVIAANYTIKEQLKGNQNCESLKSLIPNESEPDCKDVKLCVHGTKVSGESRCECTQGYTGEKCDVYVCQNYCLHGNCSVSAEGQPICSCKTGYSGQRCEVNVCHGYCLNSGVCSLNQEDSPMCQCKIDYKGKRCSVPICNDYCFHGNCNVNAEGQPICSCTGGYSGERCEFNACHDYCLNNGVCFLNKKKETVCQCTADYEGERCDIAVTHTGINGDNMSQPILRDLRREAKQIIKEELQRTLRSEVKQVQAIKEELESTLRSEVNQVQVIKEDLQRTLRFYSDKNDENEVKIQKCEKSIKDLENQSVGLENHVEITPKTLITNTFSETN